MLTINPNKRRSPLARQQASLERSRVGIGEEPAHPETSQPPTDAPSREAAQHLIQTLWTTLPPAGSTWSLAQRQAWLRSAEQVFALVYTRES